MKTLGSVAAVIAAIREEASAAVERLEHDAAADAASIHSRPAVAAPDPRNDPRVAAARTRARDEDSQQEWDAGLEDLRDRERWMNNVVAAGRAAFADTSDRSAVELSTTALIVEAAARLPDGACVVVVPAAVAAILDDAWRVQISRRTGRRLSVEAGPLTAGCIVRLADRPLTYDNSLEARERRTQVEWRAALARVYAEEVSRIEDRTGRPVAAADAAGARV